MLIKQHSSKIISIWLRFYYEILLSLELLRYFLFTSGNRGYELIGFPFVCGKRVNIFFCEGVGNVSLLLLKVDNLQKQGTRSFSVSKWERILEISSNPFFKDKGFINLNPQNCEELLFSQTPNSLWNSVQHISEIRK